jgi:hypothetical protein
MQVRCSTHSRISNMWVTAARTFYCRKPVLHGRLLWLSRPGWRAGPSEGSYSGKGPNHFVFGQRRIVWIRFGPPRLSESQSPVEHDGRFVIRRDQQLQCKSSASRGPAYYLVYQQTSNAAMPMRRGRPHGNKVCSRHIRLIEI